MEASQFRSNFPEFSDEEKYTDQSITFWSEVAEGFTDIERWGVSLYPKAVELATAHYIVIAAINIATEASGGNAGSMSGIVGNKAVGSVSVGYDTVIASEKDAGFWNQTIYGRQHIHLSRLIGAGCYQL